MQSKIKKEQERIIESIQQQERDSRKKNSRLQGLKSQLSRDKESVKEAKDDLGKAERSVSSAERTLEQVPFMKKIVDYINKKYDRGRSVADHMQTDELD